MARRFFHGTDISLLAIYQWVDKAMAMVMSRNQPQRYKTE